MSYNKPFADFLATAGIITRNGKLGPEEQTVRSAQYAGRAVTVWVTDGVNNRRRKHRVMIRCWCGRVCAAGKFHQHVKIHSPKKG